MESTAKKDTCNIPIVDVLTFFRGYKDMYHDDILKEIDNDKKNFLELFMLMSHFIDISCGNMNKIHEKTTELEIKLDPNIGSIIDEDEDIKLMTGTHGTDIMVYKKDDGIHTKSIEVKTSMVKKKKNFISSWIFSVPCGVIWSKEEMDAGFKDSPFDIVYDSVYHKMKNGIVIFKTVYQGVTDKSYSLSGEFVTLYLIYKTCGYNNELWKSDQHEGGNASTNITTKNVNLGR
jgi:hypothetical protein